MRNLSDMGTRVIVAMFAGAGLVALASGVSRLLPPSGLPDALGGWPLLAALAALLCGVCALAMSLALRWPARYALRLTVVGLMASALAWGAILAAATRPAWWVRALGWQWLAEARPALMTAGGAVVVWLLLSAALAGLLTGQRHSTRATRRAFTPLWLTPLWGAGVGVVYGLLFAIVFQAPSCPPGSHCYGLDTTPWDGLSAGVPLGAGAGLVVGLTLALSLRLALALRPTDLVAPYVATRSADA